MRRPGQTASEKASAMTPDDFKYLMTVVKDRSGIVLTPEKMYLVESRLLPIVRRLGLADLGALVGALRRNDPPSLVAEVVEAMTTNESLFFRDVKPFDQFKRLVLPKLLEARSTSRRIRIWSAACSSGQEPYSLAMILAEEEARLKGWTVEILGTDLSKAMVERSRAGTYSQFEVQRGVPAPMLDKYFVRDGDKWTIVPQLRSKVSFREFNLLDDPASFGQFDVVFCRNVLIYFDQPTKAKILTNLSRRLPGDGTLYLGGAETVIGITDKFEPVAGERGLYRLTPSPALRAAA